MENSNNHDALLEMMAKIRQRIQESIYGQNFDYEASVRTLEQHLDVAQRMNDLALMGRTLSTLGMIEMDRNSDYARAQDYFMQAVEILERADMLAGVGSMLNNLGEIYRRWGKPEQAAGYYHQAREAARQSGNVSGEIYVYSNEGMLWLNEHQPERAIPLLRQAIDMANGLVPMPRKIKELLGETYFGLATAYLQLNDVQLARAMANMSLEYAQEMALVDQLAMAHQILAQIGMIDPLPYQDVALLMERSEYFWRHLNSPNDLGKFLVVKGDYLLQLEDISGSQQALEESLACFEAAKHALQADVVRQRLQQAPFQQI